MNWLNSFFYYRACSACILLCILILWTSKVEAQDYDCTCDLTAASCDLNCCCDPDCTSDDKQLFTECTSVYKYENSRFCFPNSVTYNNFEPSFVQTSSSDLLCIYFDRYADRNSYTTPSVNSSSAQSVNAALTANAGDFGFSPATAEVNATALGTNYRAGSPVEILSASGVPSFLPLPAALNSGRCCDSSPVAFLTSEASQCVRSVAGCSASGGLSVFTFTRDFNVSRRPGVFGDSPNSTADVNVNVACQDVNGDSIDCTAPVLSSTLCQGVLTQLNFSINASEFGIVSVNAFAQLSNITVSDGLLILQTFRVDFNLPNDAAGSSRSGNPGYVTGLPLVAATTSASANSTTPLTSTQILLPVAASNGVCDGSSWQVVTFGENVRSECLQQLNWSAGAIVNCQDINNNVRQLLTQFGNTGSYRLATFGNVTVNNTEDWVNIFVDNCSKSPTRQSTACTDVILGANLIVKYAKVGRLNQFQNKIIGAELKCDTGDAVLQCYGSACDVGSRTQNVMTSFTVKFLDSSPALSEGAKQRPVYLARLPSDFFYPL